MGIARAAALALLAGLAMAAPAAAAGPEDFGPYQVKVTRVQIPLPPDPNGPEGALPYVNADLYVPDAAGRRPVVELEHAWPGTLAEFPLSGWGKRLASNGFVVIHPDRRGGSSLAVAPFLDQPADLVDLSPRVGSEDLLRVLRWAIAQNTTAGSPLFGKVDKRHIAIGGHSLGGYMATFAAIKAESEGPKLSTLVLLDPSDERLGTQTYPSNDLPYASSLPVSPQVHIPTLVLASEENTHPVQCNMNDGSDCTLVAPQQYDALTGTRSKLGLKVLGSVHEDIEDPSTIGTAASVAHLRLYQRYGIAWIDWWLTRDCDALPYLGGAATQVDIAAGTISQYPGGTPPTRCRTRR